MFTPGLVSVSFRQLHPAEIAELCAGCGLEAIEWGGDIHVPPGDLNHAREVSRITSDAGLRVAAYGSYYRAGNPEKSGAPFERVLETAIALGAPRIRVWAGTKGSNGASAEDWTKTVNDLCAVGDAAQKAGVEVCVEYHAGTLTDSLASVDRLLAETPASVRFLWQPSLHYSAEERLTALPQILPRLAHVHVYHWFPANERRPLAEGEKEWKQYFNFLVADGADRELLLEFVRDDSPDQLRADAATLRTWIQKFPPNQA